MTTLTFTVTSFTPLDDLVSNVVLESPESKGTLVFSGATNEFAAQFSVGDRYSLTLTTFVEPITPAFKEKFNGSDA